MSVLAIQAENLSKQYQITAAGRPDTLRDHLAANFKSLFHRARCSYSQESKLSSVKSEVSSSFWALKDISFEIKERETVGIIGRNGAGKSTLLKVLSRITEPTRGRASIRGRVGSLLEVGTGFHPELNGRENLYLSGAIFGMKKAEIDRKFDAIVAFAEIEKFIDTPVKHYSSGMYVRLAFAVAAHLDPDILLIDEVLSVGDLAFQRKCVDFAKRLQESDATIVYVSHNMFSVKTMCDRVIYLADGFVRFDGSPEEGIALYEKENRLQVAPWVHGVNSKASTESIVITDIQLLDEARRRCHIFNYGDRMRIRISFEAAQRVLNPNFSVSVFRSDNVACCNFNASMDGFCIPSILGRGSIELLTPPIKLVADLYVTNVIVRNAKHEDLYTAQMGDSFHVRHETLNTHYGVFHESAEWWWDGNEGEFGFLDELKRVASDN